MTYNPDWPKNIVDDGSGVKLGTGQTVDDISNNPASDSTSALMTTEAIQALGGGGGLFIEDANDNIIGGTNAGSEQSTGVNNFLGGISAGQFGDGSRNIAIGTQALEGTTGNNFDDNIGIGYQPGLSLTTGSDNIIMGYQSGYYNETGAGNVSIGYQAGYGVTGNSYSNCVFMGYQAGFKISATSAGDIIIGYRAAYNGVLTGNYQVVIGYQAGYNLTSSLGRIDIGYQAGYNNASGGNGIHIGYQAGYGTAGPTNPGNNVFIGRQAGYTVDAAGQNNIGIGVYTLQEDTIGNGNVAIGTYTMRYNDTGTNNVVIGYQAALGATTNNQTGNVFIGSESGYGVRTGANYNTALGERTCYYNSSGSYNTCLGWRAGQYNQTGQYNVLVGSEAGDGVINNSQIGNVMVGRQAGYVIETGSDYNVMVGYQSGIALATGVGNVLLGYKTGDNLVIGNQNIIIGYDLDPADSTGDNQFMLGNATYPFLKGDMANYILQINGPDGYLNFDTTSGYEGFGFRDNGGVMEYKDSGGSWTTFASLSDIRLKENIKDYSLGLDFITKLNTKRFNFKNKPKETEEGLIAQEVKSTLDDLGVEFSGWKERPDGLQELKYNKFVIPLINAVQEQKNEIEELKARIVDLEKISTEKNKL